MTVEREGVPVSVEPKALDVLLYLIDHRDRLVTKDELLDAVWKDTFVTPNVLTRVVAQLRKALGDDAQESHIIETASKRGYRFIATITEDAGRDMPAVAIEGAAGGTSEAATARAARSGLMLSVALGFVALASVVAVVLVNRGTGSVAGVAKAPAARRLTTRSGYNGMPAISPDGRSVAYSSDRTGTGEIYVTGFAPGGSDVAITSNGGQNGETAWSPDGQRLAFHSWKFGGIWIVPSGGGVPQQIVEFGSNPAWSPDGQRLAFTSDAGGMASQSTIWTVRADGTDRREITRMGQPAGGHRTPAWSHNGRFVAFTVHNGSYQVDLWAVAVADGKAHEIMVAQFVSHLQFSWDDHWLYWAGASSQGSAALFRVAVDPLTALPSGEAESVLPVDAGSLNGLSIARDGQAVFGVSNTDDNLWAIDVRPDGSAGEPVRLTDDAVRDGFASYSSDGRIAYVQMVPGRPPTTWMINEDGTNREPLLSGSEATYPEWAPDHRRMLVTQGSQLAWVDLGSRRVTPVPLPLAEARNVRLSPDGRAIAFHKIQPDGVMNVWTRLLDGGGERQVTHDREAASYPSWSPDGRWLAVEIKRLDHTFIGVVPSDGSQPIQQLTSDAGQAWPHSWAPDNDRIAFAGERDGLWNVFAVSRTTKAVRQLTHFAMIAGSVNYPAWSPSGTRIVFERVTDAGSVWTVNLK
jgi:Tol biopolymer transport system component/DNA-binding winged helix-turn-helix (wHTH) protein